MLFVQTKTAATYLLQLNMIKPLGDRVIAEPIKLENKSQGIYIGEDTNNFAIVMFAYESAPVKADELIVYNKNDFHEFTKDGRKFLIIDHDNLLAVVHE